MGNQIQNSRPISHGLPTSNVTYIGDQMQSLPAPDARFTESDTGSMGYPDYQPQNFNFATTGNGLPSWEPEQLDDRLRSLQSSRESSLTALGSRPASHHGDPAILVPQEFRIRIDKLIPDHGPVHGLYEIALIGYGFWEGLQVCFGGRLTTEATNYNGTALVCKVPPGAGPGRVQVTLVCGPRLIPFGMIKINVFPTWEMKSCNADMKLDLDISQPPASTHRSGNIFHLHRR